MPNRRLLMRLLLTSMASLLHPSSWKYSLIDSPEPTPVPNLKRLSWREVAEKTYKAEAVSQEYLCDNVRFLPLDSRQLDSLLEAGQESQSYFRMT